MKTLVVYDSVYGNTEIIAQAIGSALPGEVQVVRVGQVSAADCMAVDLLVVGSPTHGALPTEAAQALIEKIGPPAREGTCAATFDTRLTWGFLERWGGFAAEKMAAKLEEKGWTMAGTPGGFFVKGLKKGPLKRGEADRAAAWARTLLTRAGSMV
ncbi:MAG: flavodoxin family protein [Anaerolineae bacterium]|nr:flavodoxin family protein [Anaerolineae bacterium]